MNKAFYPLFLTFFLTGCTTNGLMVRSFGDYQADKEQVVYKIGSPYQINGVSYTPKEDFKYSEVGIAGWYTSSPNKITDNGEYYNPEILSAAHKTLPLPSIVKITNLENYKTAVVRVNERGPLVNNRLIDVSQKAAEELGFELNKTTLVRVEILPQESQELKAQLPLADAESEPALPLLKEENDTKPLYAPSETFLKPIYAPTIPTASPVIETTNIQQDDLPEESESDNNQIKTLNSPQPSVAIPTGYYIQHGAFKNHDNVLKLKEEIDSVYSTFIMEVQTEDGILYRLRSGPFENQEKAISILDKIHTQGYGSSQVIHEQ